MSFVTPVLEGRLGNQMFEIATALALALDNKAELLVPNEAAGSICYFDHFPLFDPAIHKVQNVWREKGHQYKKIQYKPSLKIYGYVQSEMYFKHRRKEVIKALGFHWESMKGVVALHVRRGDLVTHQHVTPLVKMSYYDRAIQHFTKMGYKNFMVFSDDIKWCRQNLKKKVNFIYSGLSDAKDDLALQSCCEHQIISNSTFSWWSAWLNQNPDKVVIAPHKSLWFAPICKLNMNTVIPEEWIQMRY